MTLAKEYTGAHETGFAKMDHGTLYYERQGVGTPVVLVHGFNLDTRMWDGMFETLAERYQVIRFDMRAFGRSDAITEPFAVYEDIRMLLDELGIDQAYFVGHSLGGNMSLEFALAYPERVKGIVLASSGLFGHPRSELGKETNDRLMAHFQRGELESALQYDLENLLDGPLGQPGRVQGPVRELLSKIRWDSYQHQFNGNFPKPLEPAAITRLEEIRVPVLTTYGDLDWPDFKEISDVIVNRVPGAQQVLLAGTGHQGCMEKPEEFVRLVEELIAQSK